MKRNILLATDFSDNAWNAIVYALKLFQDEYCTFYLINSTRIKVSTLSNLSNKLLKAMQLDAMKELRDLKELLESANVNANHDFQTILSSEDLTTAIKKSVLEREIDLVIMGTKGANSAKEILFGSNTVNVLKSLKKCPLLIIPEEYDFVRPSQIAFSTDYNRFYSSAELEPIKYIADQYDSKIRIMHINVEEKLNDIQEYNLEKLKNFLENYKHSFHWLPKYDKIANQINDFIDELDINMLAMVYYKHSLIEKITKEPVIKKIGFHPKVPFLVIPE